MRSHSATVSPADNERSERGITWKQIVENLDQPQFQLSIRQVMRSEALEHYQHDASIEFERTGELTYKALITPHGLSSVHGWQCPATIRFIAQTLGSRLIAAHGYDWYRTSCSTTEEELHPEQTTTLYFHMLESTASTLSQPAVEKNGQYWSQAIATVPERPELSRDLLRPGFCW